jgi:hypothetical protein
VPARNLKTEADALASVFGCIQSNADADLIRTPVMGLPGRHTPRLFKIFIALEFENRVTIR